MYGVKKGLRVRFPCRLIVKGVTPMIHKQVSCSLEEKAAQSSVTPKVTHQAHFKIRIWMTSFYYQRERRPRSGQPQGRSKASARTSRLMKSKKKAPAKLSKEAVGFLERFIFMPWLYFVVVIVKWHQHASVTKWKNSLASCEPGILWQGLSRYLIELHRTTGDRLSIRSASRGCLCTLASGQWREADVLGSSWRAQD